jgi:hypothetical protein
MIRVLMSLIEEKAKPLMVKKKDGAKYYRDKNGNVRIYV